MIFLLDVNALLALGIQEHEFHARTAKWVKRTTASETAFATCAITELGFLRVLLQASYAGATVAQGQKLLELLKSSRQLRFQFLVDDLDASWLPQWVKWPKQITDGHLAALAKSNGAVLATLDERIRGTFVIPR
jgi:predicted nucleic acid-binding protein